MSEGTFGSPECAQTGKLATPMHIPETLCLLLLLKVISLDRLAICVLGS